MRFLFGSLMGLAMAGAAVAAPADTAAYLMIHRNPEYPAPDASHEPGSPTWSNSDRVIVQRCLDDIRAGRQFPKSTRPSDDFHDQAVPRLVAQLGDAVNGCLAARQMDGLRVIPVASPLVSPLLR